jgi:heme exporter protein CcmD
MNHGTFIIAAYAITGLGMAWLVITSYIAMRRSEALADDLRNDG